MSLKPTWSIYKFQTYAPVNKVLLRGRGEEGSRREERGRRKGEREEGKAQICCKAALQCSQRLLFAPRGVPSSPQHRMSEAAPSNLIKFTLYRK